MKTREFTPEEWAAFRADVDAIPREEEFPEMTHASYLVMFNEMWQKVCREHKIRFNIYRKPQKVIED